jgi:hypothetical protein
MATTTKQANFLLPEDLLDELKKALVAGRKLYAILKGGIR